LGNIFKWVQKYFDYLKVIPRHLIPKYFTRIFGVLTSVILQKTYKIQNLDNNIEVIRMHFVFFSKSNISTQDSLED